MNWVLFFSYDGAKSMKCNPEELRVIRRDGQPLIVNGYVRVVRGCVHGWTYPESLAF